MEASSVQRERPGGDGAPGPVEGTPPGRRDRIESASVRRALAFRRMGVVLATTFGLIIWIVLWAIGAKAFDAFMITVLIALVAATLRMLLPYLPGNRRS
jgi:hypothetical protein